MKSKAYEFKLSNSGIDAASELIKGYLRECKLKKRDIIRYSLSVEEILLKYMESGYEGTDVKLNLLKRFSKCYISVQIGGEPANIYAKAKEETNSIFISDIFKKLGIAPEYAYKNHLNTFSFAIKVVTVNPIVKLALAFALAFIVGFSGLLLPDNIRNTVTDSVIQPLKGAFLNILGGLAGPMVFLSVAWGIYGIGDTATFKNIGKSIVTHFILLIFTITLIMSIIACPVFGVTFSSHSSGSNEINTVLNMLFDIIPSNIFSPFITGNTLQVFFIGIIVGIATLILGSKTNAVAKAVEQVNLIVQLLIEFISKLVPYFIFVVILILIWSNDISSFKSLGKYILFFLISEIVIASAFILTLSLKFRISPFIIMKKSFQTFIIALSTASSAATYGTNYYTCINSLGINQSAVSFGLPLGIVIFKPSLSLSFAFISLYFTNAYNVQISFVWLALLILTATVVSIAVPPIPGGALASYTVFISMLGLPAECIGIALACDAVIDFLSTGFDQMFLQFALLYQSSKLGLLDEKILKSK